MTPSRKSPFKLNMISLIAATLGISMLFTGCAPEKEEYKAEFTEQGLKIPELPKKFTQVTDELGDAVVYEGEFSEVSKTIPWSAYWYPVRETRLFEGEGNRLAPLQKFDLFALKAYSDKAGTADYERDNIYDEFAGTNEGHCNAWAIASIIEAEPTQDREPVSGVRFSPSDQKALLIKAYEYAQGANYYGESYRNAVSEVKDLFPHQFHRIVQYELMENRRAFAMDKDPERNVWNHPVYAANFKITKDSVNPQIFHVRATLTAKDWLRENKIDSRISPDLSLEYVYDLYGNVRPDGGLDVKFGEWTKEDFVGGVNSITQHPDIVTVIRDPKQITPRTQNTKLMSRLKYIRDIIPNTNL